VATARVNEILSEEKAAHADNVSRMWVERIRVLSRDENDSRYRAAFTQIMSSNACKNAGFMIALLRWMGAPDYLGGAWTADAGRDRPAVPDDPAVAKLKEETPRPAVGEEFEFYPDTTNPIPIWFDAEQIIDSYEKGSCVAAQELAPDTVSSLKILNANRRKHRV
jgi:hypothetical protein